MKGTGDTGEAEGENGWETVHASVGAQPHDEKHPEQRDMQIQCNLWQESWFFSLSSPCFFVKVSFLLLI